MPAPSRPATAPVMADICAGTDPATCGTVPNPSRRAEHATTPTTHQTLNAILTS
jgi:hypothetical protein